MTQDTYSEISTQIIQSVLGVTKDQQSKSPFFKQDVQPSILQNLSLSMRVASVKPAGFDFLLSDSLSNNVRRLDVAKRNLGDGMDMLMSADGALNKIQGNLERMMELAAEASNPLYNRQARESLQKEADYLAQEIRIIEESSEFKGQKLLSRDAVSLTLQVGYQSYQTSRMTIGLDQGILGQLEKIPVIHLAASTDPSTGDTGTIDPVDGGGSGSTGDGSGTGAGDGSDSGIGSETPVTSPETPQVTVAELASNAEIAAAFGWQVDDNGNIQTGQATATALSDFWSGMTQKVGKGNNTTVTATQDLKDRLDLSVDYGLHHQYVSETFSINGVDVEYQFKVSFTGGTNSEGQQVLTDLKPTMSHEEEWQNGSPINVVLGDQQVAVRFNRNLNQNQTQNFNYLENSNPGGFQNFGILTSDFRPLTVENIQETSTPPAEPPPPEVTDPTAPSELPATGGDTGSGSGGQSGQGDTASGVDGAASGKSLLETILNRDLSEVRAVDLSTNQAAQTAVVSTSEAIDFVKNLRSNLDASVRELGSIMISHETHSKALTDSSGRIQDAATAQQTAVEAQQQMLDQTTLAVSGMANTDNRAVLSLLKDSESSFDDIPYHFPRENQDKKDTEQPVNQAYATNKGESNKEPLYQFPRETDEQEQEQQQPQRQAPVQTSAEQNVA